MAKKIVKKNNFFISYQIIFTTFANCKNKKKKGNNGPKKFNFMKKKNILTTLLLFFSILPMTLFTSCDKDTNCYLDVFVVDDATQAPISGAIVEVFQDGGNKKASGVTGGDGIYSTHFISPAIVKIKATLQVLDDSGFPMGSRIGETSVRLIEGETLKAKVTLTSQLYN